VRDMMEALMAYTVPERFDVARPSRRVARLVRAVPPAGQVPVRSADAYLFQGRSIRNGESIRTGAGSTLIM
jgi:hypothetical protein